MIFLLLQTERDQVSLFHAASLGFWGIHDRTSLLQNAVNFTLTDGKAQLMFYNRWYSDYRQSAPSSPTKVYLILFNSLIMSFSLGISPMGTSKAKHQGGTTVAHLHTG